VSGDTRRNVKARGRAASVAPNGAASVAPNGAASVAPDGSPVAFYRRLPAMGEPELVHGLVRPGATILDLGCGPGRIAGPLAVLGHRVTGVDDGAGMIEALPPVDEAVLGPDADYSAALATGEALVFEPEPEEDEEEERRSRARRAAELHADETAAEEETPAVTE